MRVLIGCFSRSAIATLFRIIGSEKLIYVKSVARHEIPIYFT